MGRGKRPSPRAEEQRSTRALAKVRGEGRVEPGSGSDDAVAVRAAIASAHGSAAPTPFRCIMSSPEGGTRLGENAMTRIDWAAKALARALAVLGLGVLLCFAVMTMVDGLLRFFFARPIDAVRDVGGLVAAFAVACCIPVAIVERSNITIRFLSGRHRSACRTVWPTLLLRYWSRSF